MGGTFCLCLLACLNESKNAIGWKSPTAKYPNWGWLHTQWMKHVLNASALTVLMTLPAVAQQRMLDVPQGLGPAFKNAIEAYKAAIKAEIAALQALKKLNKEIEWDKGSQGDEGAMVRGGGADEGWNQLTPDAKAKIGEKGELDRMLRSELPPDIQHKIERKIPLDPNEQRLYAGLRAKYAQQLVGGAKEYRTVLLMIITGVQSGTMDMYEKKPKLAPRPEQITRCRKNC